MTGNLGDECGVIYGGLMVIRGIYGNMEDLRCYRGLEIVERDIWKVGSYLDKGVLFEREFVFTFSRHFIDTYSMLYLANTKTKNKSPI